MRPFFLSMQVVCDQLRSGAVAPALLSKLGKFRT